MFLVSASYSDTSLERIVNYNICGADMAVMFKLGEYDELTARDLAERLREMKIRVDIRPSIVADLKITHVLQGRFSELKNEIKDERTLKKYEHYLESVRKTFAENPAPGEFYRRYQAHAVPQWVKIAEKMDALVLKTLRGDAATEEESFEESPEDAEPPAEPSPEEASQGEMSPEAAGTSGEVEEDAEEYNDTFIDNQAAAEFIKWFFTLNDLEIDEDPGDKLDDPIVAIPVVPTDYPEHPMLRTNIYVSLDKAHDVYIDEWSVFTCEDPDRDFFNEFQNEAIEIMAIHTILNHLTDMPPSGKTDMDSFERMCGVYMEMESGIFDVDAYSVAEDLAKILEKNGVVKIKGDMIRWKKI